MKWLSKRVLPTPALGSADPALTLSYRLWSNMRVEGYLPARCQMDTPHFRLVIPGVQWLGPIEREWAQPLELRGYEDSFSPYPFAVQGTSSLADALADDVRLTQFTGGPLFQIIELARNERTVVVQLLLVPFADDGLKVSDILVVAREGKFNMAADTYAGEEDRV